MNRRHLLAPQRGTSLLGLVVVAVIVGFIVLMGMRAFPSVNEYFTIRKVVAQIMKDHPASPGEIRAAFERSASIEYSIKTISSSDLVITPVGDDRLRTSFAYNVQIPVVEPVFLLIKYEGSATSGGGAP